MKGYSPRVLESEIKRRLGNSPAVALVGPRQCGKSTLARHLLATQPGSIYMDLERPSDRRRMADPEAFFALHRKQLVCLDEVQRVPDLFPVLRSVIDERNQPGQFLILGSASPELLRQSSETLAGRLAILELTPFLLPEVSAKEKKDALFRLWLRGGFPRSYLATDDQTSFEWRSDFVRTFLERDLPQFAPRVAPERVERFWGMCAHLHGQILNAARIGAALGVSGHTVRAYLDLMQHTFMLRLLMPIETNLEKRLVRSPKLLLRDTGILHNLLDIETHDDLLGHPNRGASWEGLVTEHVISAFPRWRPSFYRTQAGAELDLVLERGHRRIGIECKASTAPHVSRGFWSAADDLDLEQGFVVAPIAQSYPIGPRAAALPVDELLDWAPRIDAGKRHPALG